MGYFALILLGFSITFAIYMYIKNNVTHFNRMLVLNAIYLYRRDLIEQDKYDEAQVNMYDLESYGKTLWRLWDWGYEHILPPEKFEIIKPYIKDIKKEL